MNRMRNWKSYPMDHHRDFRKSLLRFADQFDQFLFLDSCENEVYSKNRFHYLLAAGKLIHIEADAGNAFDQLKKLLDEHNDWCFGYFGYDLKNELEKLTSSLEDHHGFPDMIFFIPEIIVMADDEIRIGLTGNNHEEIFNSIKSNSISSTSEKNEPVQLKARIIKDKYLEKIRSIRAHIAEGDIYEMNLCQEFFSKGTGINPVMVFDDLCNASKAPFSALFKWDEHFVISASPERFLKKTGNRIVSQPIKGTIKRSRNSAEDAALKQQLASSEKDRAENVMIVDLVRNDLAKSCATGSVHVDELFGIYSFEQVHQMVSTISGELKKEVHIVDAIKNAFPMGSMTGAPKVMAMSLIEKYEEIKRGVFSGSIGYFTPPLNEGRDFDFNVVIRSIFYHAPTKYVSALVGGAIVYDSVPEVEYDECLTKLGALANVLNSDGN